MPSDFDNIGLLDSIFDAVEEEVIEDDDDIDTENVSEDDDYEDSDIEDSEESEEEDDYEYPEFVPEDLQEPEFKDTKEELEWYRANYRKTFEVYKSEKFAESLSDNYSEHLLKAEKDFEKLKGTKEAFEKNPELMFKLYYPEQLSKNGIEPKFTEQDKITLVDKALTREFGVDYKDKYDVNSLSIAGSLSSKMFKKQQEILDAIEEQEQDNIKTWEEAHPPKEVLDARLKEQRTEYFREYNDDEFDKFLDEVKGWKYNLQDIHRAMYFDSYAKLAYEKGLEAGKKGMVNELKNVGKVVHPIVQPKEEKKEVNFLDSYLQNRIPRY